MTRPKLILVAVGVVADVCVPACTAAGTSSEAIRLILMTQRLFRHITELRAAARWLT